MGRAGRPELVISDPGHVVDEVDTHRARRRTQRPSPRCFQRISTASSVLVGFTP
jgi:hypothetical protein